jgi:C-terminal processing protease CtpA/Prc
VVTTSSDNRIQRGDVIVSIDKTPAARLLSRAIELVSGSRQWRVVQALQTFGSGPAGTTLVARVRRDGREYEVITARSDSPVSERILHAPIEPLEDGIYYVDLTRAAMKDIDGIVDRLAAASGVIFDVRGRPNHNHDVLAHLLTRRDDIRGWERIPRIIRPDSASAPSSWEDTSSWNMPVLQVQISPPHISGKVAFLTDARAISYAEDVMTFIEYYHLGEIVGATTAGTDGDVAEIRTPTGCGIYFTGRRVTRLDGSQLHLLGVRPTIPVSRSLAGVAAGRDEVLERALAYARGAAR